MLNPLRPVPILSSLDPDAICGVASNVALCIPDYVHGKSALIERFINGVYESNTKSTIGAAFAAKKVPVGDGRSVILGVWDTAGAERFEALSRVYYHAARAAIVCFDATNEISWKKLHFWVNELKEREPKCRVFIAVTKCDLTWQRGGLSDSAALPPGSLPSSSPVDRPGTGPSSFSDNELGGQAGGAEGAGDAGQREWAVPREAVAEFASSMGAEIFETSAKAGKGVTELFTAIARELAALPPVEVPADTIRLHEGGGGGGEGAGGGPSSFRPAGGATGQGMAAKSSCC